MKQPADSTRPNLTQLPIGPEEKFDYGFTPPDAGAYWYHPHGHVVEHQKTGLAGFVRVVES